ncbi:MAG TPA: nitroreductase/quinone reductase family protein [Vicinamibacterales bacterium]|nr:nitroreductase/quinone reductase family protein [Vicinamibacterales bacterium]
MADRFSERIVMASLRRDDPAEQSGALRFFYRNWRPTRFGRAWNRAFAWASGLGLGPPFLVTLLVKGRRSGELRANILVTATYQGQRYLVSMLGERSDWVQNVRAARGMGLIKHGRTVPVRLIEIAPDKRAPILKAWCQVATSGRHHLPVPFDAPVSSFEEISADYPVFRIDPVS